VSRAAVLAEIARAVLEPEELLAAWRGEPVPEVERGHRGVLHTIPRSGYQVDGDVVALDAWQGITERVPLGELHALAAAAGSAAAADRLAAALADVPKAMKDAERYIRKHGEGGHFLTLGQQERPEWLAIRERLWGVRTARRLWWTGEGLPGEQMDLFAPVTGIANR
jgi:hypothetical protein